jgi:hypothetical protein
MNTSDHFNLGTAAGRGDGNYQANSTRFGGLGINAAKYGGKENTIGEANYATNGRGVAKSGTY